MADFNRKTVKKFIYLSAIALIFFTACASSHKNISETRINQSNEKNETTPRDTITLIFGGDIMAHSVNYNISSYSKIWRDIKYIFDDSDVAFANIESPIDTLKPISSYPNFNMNQKYVEAAVDCGFNVFSLCNNHSNDMFLEGIKETIKTTERITKNRKESGHSVYFSGLKETAKSTFSYNIVESLGWKILFLPVTELLNRPDFSSYINYIKTDDRARKEFISLVRQLRAENKCDLFVISIHTSEPEYTRAVTDSQASFYDELLNAGADIVWANHPHIIKNRKIIIDTISNRDKIIMYANGNTISGQRTKPELTSKNPVGERDNTGDGLLYKVILKKNKDGSMKIQKCEPIYITTYINTANEYVVKPLNQDFVDYLYDVQRTDWAKYIERRIKINKDATKDLIEWR